MKTKRRGLPADRSRRARARSGRVVVAAALVAIAMVLATACESESADTASAGKGEPMTLKVMVFNIEYGGDQISFKKTVEAAQVADPDVIGVEEAETSIPRLAKALGWQYYNTGMHIVSKYPILEPSAEGSYALIEVQQGKVVALSNVHLPSAPYGPYFVKRGSPAEKVIALEERVRLPAVAKQLEVLPPLAESGIPVFVTGDFNSPSHLDYTEAAVGSREQVKYAIEWPVSKAFEDAGFVDSWRATHPDPVANPGLTWWAARPKVPGEWNPGPKSPQDRIDFVYAAGPAKVTASEIVGEEGGPEVTSAVTPWPSDHRAVVSTFEVTPGAMPVLVAVDAWLVTQGDPLAVTYRSGKGSGETVVIASATGNPADGGIASQPAAVDSTGSLVFDTAQLPPGAYQAALLDNGPAVVRTVPFWVQEKGAKVEISTDAPSYSSGDPITVSWLNAPANRWDWIGVYEAGADDPNVDWYLIWQYTGGAMSGTVHGMPAGSLTMEKETIEGSPWPLPSGKYVVYYLLADGYEAVARAEFTVTK